MKTVKRFTSTLFLCLVSSMFLSTICYAADAGQNPGWLAIANPADRALHTAVLDELNDRMVVFGGLGYGGLMNDVWTMSHDFWSGQFRWSRSYAKGPAPDPRRAHGAAYDPSRGAMYVFGGNGGDYNYLNDVWRLDLTPHGEEWEELGMFGTPPQQRYHSSVISAPYVCAAAMARCYGRYTTVPARTITGTPSISTARAAS